MVICHKAARDNDVKNFGNHCFKAMEPPLRPGQKYQEEYISLLILSLILLSSLLALSFVITRLLNIAETTVKFWNILSKYQSWNSKAREKLQKKSICLRV